MEIVKFMKEKLGVGDPDAWLNHAVTGTGRDIRNTLCNNRSSLKILASRRSVGIWEFIGEKRGRLIRMSFSVKMADYMCKLYYRSGKEISTCACDIFDFEGYICVNRLRCKPDISPRLDLEPWRNPGTPLVQTWMAENAEERIQELLDKVTGGGNRRYVGGLLMEITQKTEISVSWGSSFGGLMMVIFLKCKNGKLLAYANRVHDTRSLALEATNHGENWYCIRDIEAFEEGYRQLVRKAPRAPSKLLHVTYASRLYDMACHLQHRQGRHPDNYVSAVYSVEIQSCEDTYRVRCLKVDKLGEEYGTLQAQRTAALLEGGEPPKTDNYRMPKALFAPEHFTVGYAPKAQP